MMILKSCFFLLAIVLRTSYAINIFRENILISNSASQNFEESIEHAHKNFCSNLLEKHKASENGLFDQILEGPMSI